MRGRRERGRKPSARLPSDASAEAARSTQHALKVNIFRFAAIIHKCSNKSIRALRKIGKFRKATIPERAPGARAPNSQQPTMASLRSSLSSRPYASRRRPKAAAAGGKSAAAAAAAGLFRPEIYIFQ